MKKAPPVVTELRPCGFVWVAIYNDAELMTHYHICEDDSVLDEFVSEAEHNGSIKLGYMFRGAAAVSYGYDLADQPRFSASVNVQRTIVPSDYKYSQEEEAQELRLRNYAMTLAMTDLLRLSEKKQGTLVQ